MELLDGKRKKRKGGAKILENKRLEETSRKQQKDPSQGCNSVIKSNVISKSGSKCKVPGSKKKESSRNSDALVSRAQEKEFPERCGVIKEEEDGGGIPLFPVQEDQSGPIDIDIKEEEIEDFEFIPCKIAHSEEDLKDDQASEEEEEEMDDYDDSEDSAAFSSNPKMETTINFVKTTRGKDKLCYNGYYYTRSNATKSVSYWRCEDRMCPGRLVLSRNQEVMKTSDHNHAGGVEKVYMLQAKNKITEKASTTSETPAAIVSEVISEVPECSQPLLPTTASMTRNIRKIRSKQFPKLPTSLADVDVQGRFRITLGGENWLLHDSGPDDEDRVLIFATPSSLQKLGSSKHWFADGTFETCPNIFYQIYTIHAEIHGEIHPLLFALLPGKSEEIYVKMLYALLENMEALGIQTEVTEVSIDFELAAKNAFLHALGDVNVHFCFFHFCQTTWRKIQQLGLVNHYNNDTEFSLFCRKVNALAFLPIDDVPRGMQCLKREAPENALPFIEYVDNTFVNGVQRRNGRRSKPLFSVHEWNVYELTLEGNARTINSVEAWHRRFGVLVRSHSNLYNVLDALRREEQTIKTRISQLTIGANPKKPNTKVARREKRIYNVVDDYQNRLLEDYLRSIAHNLGSF